ncbi:MAG TPA: hypothetical protein VMD91_01035 [Candidatus Sulfotelmatobacter sp.]|nr:hypothetical protein [Candidatus Sulfotelmatobacter sp.]
MRVLGWSSGIAGRYSVALAAIGAVLLASFAAAALAHGAIDLAGRLTGGGDYADRRHVAVGPVSLAIAGLVVAGIVRIALDVAARRERGDAVANVLRRLTAADPRLVVLAVAGGGFLTLLSMEFSEQLVAYGHVVGVGDALGGTPWLGAALVGAAGALVALLGLRLAGWLAAATATVVAALVGWLRAVRERDDRLHAPRTLRPVRPVALCFLARCSGLRAPPLTA